MRLLIVGAGVTVPSVIEALVSRSDIPIHEIHVFDDDGARIHAIQRVVEHVLRGAQGLRVLLTRDIDAALRARPDVSILSIRPGLEDGRAQDEIRAKRLGLLANETVGAAGLAFACRAVPAVITLAERILDANPDCLIINFTNPVGLVTSALHAHGVQRAYGVCSSSEKSVRILVADEPDLRWHCLVFGLNHLSWAYSVSREGIEYMPDILASEDLLRKCQPWFSVELPRRHHALLNEYNYYYFLHADAMRAQSHEAHTRGEYLAIANARLRRDLGDAVDAATAHSIYMAYIRGRKHTYMGTGDKERAPWGAGYSTPALAVIEGAVLDRPMEVACVAPGHGVPGLPERVGVEATAEFQDGKARVIAPSGLAPEVWNLLQRMATYEDVARDAIMARDEDGLINALNLHPLCADPSSNLAYIRETITSYPLVFGPWRG